MRLNSIYHYFRMFFRYPESTDSDRSRRYAFAIRDALALIDEVYMKKSYRPFIDYLSREKNNALAVKFVTNFDGIAKSHDPNYIIKSLFFRGTIVIDASYLNSNRRGIEIPFPYVIDRSKNNISIPTFGAPNNMKDEVAVLLGLINEFRLEGTWPTTLETISYWDLSSGLEKEMNLNSVTPVNRNKLIEVLNKF
ncbi:hypothetical protein GTO91_04105 [Heliobacterium undosum]|uniref:Uncharacterized protein n=1 Tax=Heliomicrobium undosum TaxID=121734 RepID=A0A845KYE9_9FIRM|nr:hypothetical protein [Heliomicrobium undosum]MZP28892.1 hypothetical protein [Heliomicrobium undosum]